MESSIKINNFLIDLLALQQDGERAISAPTNWNKKPLLDVPTEIDPIIDELQDKILQGNERNEIAQWYFLIGSPGNGKSAAVGKLCNKLESEKDCIIKNENNVPISELEPTEIPYALNVYEAINKYQYASVQIVQDASVVRTEDGDPATEFLNTLEYAWEKGISLVVCTNRGVFEKAFRNKQSIPEVTSKPWYKILRGIIHNKNSPSGKLDTIYQFDSKKPVFTQVQVGYIHLDNRSLLIESDIFEKLILNATSGEHWEQCNLCSLSSMCPFKTNQIWLTDERGRERVLKLLKRVEVFSGQVIVFREALAIISFILSGCPEDYNNLHPCEWVRIKIEGNDIFSLAMRRVYMNLFCSYFPYGLEEKDWLYKLQINAFKNLLDYIDENKTTTIEAINHVINNESKPPSTDAGVTRLLSKGGIISNLDPCMGSLPTDFYEEWDSESDINQIINPPLFSEIEKTCLIIWNDLEEGLEKAANYSVYDAHWALKRWSSNFLLHLGALYKCYSIWSKELDEFTELLNLVSKPPQQRTGPEKRKIRHLNDRLENLLGSTYFDQDKSKVQLTEAVTLTGEWVRQNLKPEIAGSQTSGSMSLEIMFREENREEEHTVFAALVYLWLIQLAEGKLDPRCFPQNLLSGIMDARVRAATKGKYAFQDNDVEIIINTSNGGQFRLFRFDGDVDVDDTSE